MVDVVATGIVTATDDVIQGEKGEGGAPGEFKPEFRGGFGRGRGRGGDAPPS